jgi:hypothetical protein
MEYCTAAHISIAEGITGLSRDGAIIAVRTLGGLHHRFARFRKGQDYFARGKHLFYVWCPGSKSHLANAECANAEEAQIRLYNEIKANDTKRWPVRQGPRRSTARSIA